MVLGLLATARRQGGGFEDAWRDAVEVALRGLPALERSAWRRALVETEGSWRAAWERSPGARSEAAVAKLAGLETAA